jgi:hypothetical protein
MFFVLHKTRTMFYTDFMNARPTNTPEPRTFNGRLVVTAKDIAEAIAFKKDRKGFSKALRQVKHWTDSGVLETITALDTGSGVAREYVDHPTVLIAAIMQELVLFGCTIDQLLPIAQRLYDDHDGGDPDGIFDAAMTDEWKGYLSLEYDVNERGQLALQQVRTFSTGPEEEDLEHNMPQVRSSLIIDLGAVASRISWPAFKYYPKP